MKDERKANDYQVGGVHYKCGYEHWDLVLEIPYSYLEGQATKYVARARKKGQQVQDLKKALHFVNKLQEDGNYQPRALKLPEIISEIARFVEENGLGPVERRFCEVMGTWEAKSDLDEARQLIFTLLDEAEGVDSGPVPLTEENHYAERAE